MAGGRGDGAAPQVLATQPLFRRHDAAGPRQTGQVRFAGAGPPYSQ